MARHEKPIDPAGGPLAELALDLRALRADSGLTYREMAEMCNVVASTLSQAASGTVLPSWETVSTYVTVCGDQPARWWARHEAARNAGKPKAAASESPAVAPIAVLRTAGSGIEFPVPYDATSSLEFVAALRQVRAWAGQPSLRVIERRSGIPSSTLHNMLNRTTLPPRWDNVAALLGVCGADPARLREWNRIWNRLVMEPPGAVGLRVVGD